MAIVTSNSLLQHLSGMLGPDIIFKKYKTKTVVSVKPSTRKKNSPLQQQNCNRFKEAARHARTILHDPVKREHYRKLAKKQNKHSAYNAIIAEYMLTIHINAKNIPTGTTANKRLTLSVTKKDFKVKEVNIEIKSSRDQTIIAGGKANRINTVDWVYKMPALLEKDYTIIVTAIDALSRSTQKQLYI